MTEQATEQLTCEMGYYDRLAVGKEDEKQQVDLLRRKGWDIRDVSAQVDMVDKIDRVVVIDGVEYTVQIKGRDTNSEKKTTYTDLLADVFEPYCGFNHQFTVVGRDAVSKYDWYVCRIQNMLYVVWGPVMKKFVRAAIEEWENSPQRLKVDAILGAWAETLGTKADGETLWVKRWDLFQPGGYIQRESLRCEINRNLMVKCTQDRKNHRPKLLVFVPPAMFAEDELYVYEME